MYQKNKINANIFVSLALKEWKSAMEAGLPDDVDSLFSFAVDDNASRTMARAAGSTDPLIEDIDNETLDEEQIRHLLSNVHAPSRLNERDLKSFLALIREVQKEKTTAQKVEADRLSLVKQIAGDALQDARDRKSEVGEDDVDKEKKEKEIQTTKTALVENKPLSIKVGDLKKILYNIDLNVE